MSDDERWDLTDVTGAPTGVVHRRGDPMPAGAFHVVVAVCVHRADGLVLLTFRMPDKPYPSSWEFTAGSALAGESSREGAVRELAEETGIVTEPDALRFVGRHVEASALVDLYALRVPADVELRLQADEVAAAEWVTPDEVRRRLAAGVFAAPWPPRVDALGDELWRAVAG